MFRKKEDIIISSRSLMRNKDAKILRETLTNLFPAPRGWLSTAGATATASSSSSSTLSSSTTGIEGIFPVNNKIGIELIKYTNKMTGYGIADERSPYFVDLDTKGNGRFLPTLHCLWKLIPSTAAASITKDTTGGSTQSSSSSTTVLPPTLYPPLTPTLLIPQAVSSYIIGGADLMLQGVLVPKEGGLPPFAAGALVTIRVIGNPAPLAIGEAIVSSMDCVNVLQMKGKGIRILHHYGDVLWDAGGRVRPNEGFRGNLVVPIGASEPGFDTETMDDDDDDDEDEEEEREQKNNKPHSITGSHPDTETSTMDNVVASSSTELSTLDERNDTKCTSTTITDNLVTNIDTLTINDDNASESTPAAIAPSVPYWETLDSTALLEATFLQALRRKIKSSELPILANVLFGTYMASVRPKGTVLDPRKTKWKKFDTFLQDMASTGLIAIEEDRSKGNVRLMGIDRNHPTYKQYRPWPASVEDAHNDNNDENTSDNENTSKQTSVSNIAWLPPIVEQYIRPRSAASLIITTVFAVALAKGKGNELPGLLVHHGRRRGGPSTSKALGTSLIRLADMGLQDILSASNPHESSSSSSSMDHTTTASSAPSSSLTLNQILGILPPLSSLLLTKTEANSILSEYWSFRRLQDSNNKRNVLLDTPLAGALAGKTITDIHTLTDNYPNKRIPTDTNGDDEDDEEEEENDADNDNEAEEGIEGTESFSESSSSLIARTLPLCIPFNPQDISSTLMVSKESLTDAPSLPREDVAKLWKSRMEKWYTITYRQGGSTGVEEIIVKQGQPPIVSIFVKRIQGGRRSTTHCTGPDLYRVDLHDVAKALKKHLAASATVQQAGNNVKVKEIMVQGDEAERLATIIITEFGIPKNCVHISEDSNGGGGSDAHGGSKKKGGKKK